ncbi:hypothetical protein GLYMA_17G155350v4 [Glycine max]|nr:hypothetical protein GYH30_047391 [Glycine max]KRH04334.2 hypothetical protein GLYMA_17G155350v4 [Glycine max]
MLTFVLFVLAMDSSQVMNISEEACCYAFDQKVQNNLYGASLPSKNCI